MQRQHHVREAGELEEHEEDELGGEVLPQQLAGASDVGVKVLLRLRALHGVHHQVHQLLLQHGAPLLLLAGGRRGALKGTQGEKLNRGEEGGGVRDREKGEKKQKKGERWGERMGLIHLLINTLANALMIITR